LGISWATNIQEYHESKNKMDDLGLPPWIGNLHVYGNSMKQIMDLPNENTPISHNPHLSLIFWDPLTEPQFIRTLLHRGQSCPFGKNRGGGSWYAIYHQTNLLLKG
jgi:hypothetical protein